MVSIPYLSFFDYLSKNLSFFCLNTFLKFFEYQVPASVLDFISSSFFS